MTTAAMSHRPAPTTTSNSSSAASVFLAPSQHPPPLERFVHIVKLVAPDNNNEFLKVLNVPIYPDTLKIGRQNTPKTTNKITDGYFDSRVLSRNHAELFVKDNQLYIRDLKSSNGTFINEIKLDAYKDYPLKTGDRIDLGTTLESQMAHKKITCIIGDIDFINLSQYNAIVRDITSRGDLATKKLELFNTPFDALLFGDIVDDSHNDLLMQLINVDENTKEKDTALPLEGKFEQGLDLAPSKNMQDVVNKLIVAVNNEYIQQQRLKSISKFIRNYNNSLVVAKNPSKLKNYSDLLNPNQKQRDLNHEKINELESKLKLMKNELEMNRLHLSEAKFKESEEARRLKTQLDDAHSIINQLKAKSKDEQDAYLKKETEKKTGYDNQVSLFKTQIQNYINEIESLKQDSLERSVTIDESKSKAKELQNELDSTLNLLNIKEEENTKSKLHIKTLEKEKETKILLLKKLKVEFEAEREKLLASNNNNNFPFVAGLTLGVLVTILGSKILNWI